MALCKRSYLVHKIVEEKQRCGEIAREEAFDGAFLTERPARQVELAAKDEQDDGQAEVLCPRSQKAFEGKGAKVFALCSQTLSEPEVSDIARGPLEQCCNRHLVWSVVAIIIILEEVLTSAENQPYTMMPTLLTLR